VTNITAANRKARQTNFVNITRDTISRSNEPPEMRAAQNLREVTCQKHKSKKTEQPTAAFVLSILAGIWMLGAGGMMGGFGWGGMIGDWHGMGGWMWGRGMRTYGVWWPWFGIFAWIVVLIGAVMLYVRPEQRRSWGVVILAASAQYNFLGMMGLLAGTMGVIGGALALGAKD
jgi:hypothetical protein